MRKGSIVRRFANGNGHLEEVHAEQVVWRLAQLTTVKGRVQPLDHADACSEWGHSYSLMSAGGVPVDL